MTLHRLIHPSAIALICVFLLASCGDGTAKINLAHQPTELERSIPDNFVVFVDRDANHVHTTPEINGWLLLEANLRSALDEPVDASLESAVSLFGEGKLAGWWPKQDLKTGKPYFSDLPAVTLMEDADDTAWLLRLTNRLIDEPSLKLFLSGETLPEAWQKPCKEVSCELPQMIRVWSEQDWHDDMDIVTSSSLLTVLDIHRSPLARRVFDQNSAMINQIITQHDYTRFMGYYEPSVSGTLLILFNHIESDNPFLSVEAEQKLRADLEENLHLLNSDKVSSKWGAGEEWIGNYQLVYFSERLPELMYSYAQKILEEGRTP